MKKLEHRYDVINHLIEKYGYKNYLEIGVQSAYNFKKVVCENKISVDPDNSLYPQMTHAITSDEYFKKHAEFQDIVFIDGEHTHEQVYKDVDNSLIFLNENGTIICHDGLPLTKEAAAVPRVQKVWNGDVYKAIIKLRSERSDLEIFTIDTDQGLVVIRKSKNPVKKLDLKGLEINYENFDKNRKNWMNVVSVEQAIKML